MEQIVNMRDLGGMVNQAGLTIKKNKLFRSGNPAKATEVDCEKLEQLNLQQIIDFRCASEKSERERSFANRFNWISQPVSVGNIVDLFDPTLTKETAFEAMCQLYRRLPVEFQSQYKYFLSQAQLGQTMLYHCTAGKDRTGFGSLLLLSALGINKEAIMADYLLSNQSVIALKKQILSASQYEKIDPEVFNVLLEVHTEYLDNALEVINKMFGGLDKYLKYTLAVDVESIRAQYLQS